MKLSLPHLSRKALLLSVAVCSCVAASCSRGQVAEDKPAETVPVQELVAQADKYYAARAHERLRQLRGRLEALEVQLLSRRARVGRQGEARRLPRRHRRGPGRR